jgi:hypothetical protein
MRHLWTTLAVTQLLTFVMPCREQVKGSNRRGILHDWIHQNEKSIRYPIHRRAVSLTSAAYTWRTTHLGIPRRQFLERTRRNALYTTKIDRYHNEAR